MLIKELVAKEAIIVWAAYAMLSAVLAGTSAILSKRGADRMDAAVLSQKRTVVVLAVAVLAVIVRGDLSAVIKIGIGELAVLAASGAATAFAWLCYFRALAAGSVNRVAAVDKFTTVLTLLGGWIFLGESMGAAKITSMGLLSVGILLMASEKSNTIDKTENKPENDPSGRRWFLWALGSVLLTSASVLLSKVGVRAISAEIALVVRTFFVLAITYAVILIKGFKSNAIDKTTNRRVLLSGLATGLGWICYFRALSGAEAGAVQVIDKLSILVTAVLARICFREKLNAISESGLLLIVAGILVLYFSMLG